MKARELLDANKLSDAIAELTQDVKTHPADTRLRTFLFEVLCFQGEYQRAQSQLDVIGLQNEKAGIGVEIYRSLLQAEAIRRRVFAGIARPSFLLDPPQHVQSQLEAIGCLSRREPLEAKNLLAKCENERPQLRGTLKGKPFSTIRDSDDRIGSVLEIFIKNTYAWIPFEQIVKVNIAPPKQLRDLLWAPTSVEMVNGQGGEAHVPVLYVGSEEDDSEQVRLGRITEWVNLGGGLAGGVGQRTILVDNEEKSVLELQDLEFGR